MLFALIIVLTAFQRWLMRDKDTPRARAAVQPPGHVGYAHRTHGRPAWSAPTTYVADDHVTDDDADAVRSGTR